ncbi:MAG TPA: polyphenol oxidase family protein [Thermoanaerobaculia bacterium]|nr:polyphenol oxidase family protein [Thermoanaerobaculia bacterium]
MSDLADQGFLTAQRQADTWTWWARRGRVEVLFTGRGPAASGREEVLGRIVASREPGCQPVRAAPTTPATPNIAWARQIHSARVLRGRPGDSGEGDALVTAEPRLALAVSSADCVPLLLAGPHGIAAAHAGWRGIVAGVVGATVAALARPATISGGSGGKGDVGGAAAAGDPAGCTAWVGPAIGACCYETGPDVAAQVAAASGPEVVVPGTAGRPHLDLTAAVCRQLAAAGVHDVRWLISCTRCDAERLWSYRREGKAAGRNLAFIWLSA